MLVVLFIFTIAGIIAYKYYKARKAEMQETIRNELLLQFMTESEPKKVFKFND
jgi:cbb3-type cytochrome oxidase subunit 3